MNKYKEKTEAVLINKISRLTFIPAAILRKALKENGVLHIFKYPNSIEGLNDSQLDKLLVLKDFINLYNETAFLKEIVILNSTTKAGEFFKSRLMNITDREYFEVCFLNSQNEIIEVKRLFEGTINESAVYPRVIIQEVLRHNANFIVIAHNHPGGNISPSSADIDVTKKISKALETISVTLIDHIIVAGDSYTSFAEKGLL